MGTHRNLSSRVIGVHGLPAPVISLIQEQAEARGLYRDPLPHVTHGLRTDEVVSAGRRFGRARPRRHATELLLTPDVLVVSDRDPDRDGADPDAQVTFHHLHQIEVTAAGEGQAGATLLSTPVGSTERSTYAVPSDGGPETVRFLEALVDAAAQARGTADVPSSRTPVESLSPEYS
ncbi:hypothetical protein [Actinomycetospora cinnamomea]|uniref:Uncharacterized protein n=1 Tax=Actinomycetospora cinnamomea TaxID=663609 RepID=A0A2U1FSI3_9PSEU|nr:hypothetical protein [Actinomycetospora cinnamomea]PVZ15010.1 hypothetical protein C8D89_101879 [Actinomycetospora cinnamomea]